MIGPRLCGCTRTRLDYYLARDFGQFMIAVFEFWCGRVSRTNDTAVLGRMKAPGRHRDRRLRREPDGDRSCDRDTMQRGCARRAGRTARAQI